MAGNCPADTPDNPCSAAEGLRVEAYCCETMRWEIVRVSDRSRDQYGRHPNCLIHYSPDIREHGLFDHDRCSAGTTAVLGIYFCLW